MSDTASDMVFSDYCIATVDTFVYKRFNLLSWAIKTIPMIGS